MDINRMEVVIEEEAKKDSRYFQDILTAAAIIASRYCKMGCGKFRLAPKSNFSMLLSTGAWNNNHTLTNWNEVEHDKI